MGFISWHKGVLKKVQQNLGISDYGILWIAFFKGILLGALIMYFHL